MRVRILKKTQAYWNYGVQTIEPPQVIDGEFARHLADNAPQGSVEVLEEDREEARAAAAAAAELAAPKPEDPDAGGNKDPEDPGGDSGDKDPEDPPVGDTPPVDGTIDDLMKWIGEDRDRAGQALEAEQAKDKPRSTVVRKLTAITEAEPTQ